MSNYYLSFSGEINNQLSLEQVKLNFKNKFKLTELQLVHVFSGKNMVLKKNLTQAEVLYYIAEIDKLGGISYIETMNKTVLPSGIDSDRRYNQRRIRLNGRRNTQRDSFLSNRRNSLERRVAGI